MKLFIFAVLLALILPSRSIDILPLPPNILPAPLACVNDDWTAWYDVDSPTGDGDFESLSFIIESYPEMVCDQPTHVEGRVARKGTDARDSGQRISLNPMVGLLCRNEENLERCLDYEVRFCCPRDRPSCDDGEWTNYFSTDTPDGQGDFETLAKVRLLDPAVCEIPTSVDARRISDSIHWSLIGRGRLITNGFECKNILTPIARIAVLPILPQDRCDDYEVRFCCPKPNPPQCGPEDWTPWLNADNPLDGCDMETLPVIAEKYPDLVCESPVAVDVRLFLTGMPFDPTLPNIRYGTFGFECCSRFERSCSDYEVRFCCPTTEPPPVECDGKWTRYFDRDNPSGKGDYENLRLLLVEYPNQICEHPIAVDAKLVGSETHYPIPGLVATETPEEGFFCQNADQFGRTCLDFEVRFCCPEEEPSECDENDWTDFYDIDDPTGLDMCDCEDLPTLIDLHPEVCPKPTAIDVKLTNGADITTINQVVHMSLTEGFQCYNFEQATGESCCDYKVRYCCPPAGPPPDCDICTEWNGAWTEYFNVDLPLQDPDNCDCELLSIIRENNQDVCEFPIAIDARPLSRLTQIQDTEVSLLGGFRCKNSNEQLCKDYKVRFCCPNDPYVIGPISYCTGSGDPHYSSLDGRRFDFQGICTYIFVATTEEAEDCHLYPFSVEVENEHRGASTAVSYLKKIIVRFDAEVIELRPMGVYVNSVEVDLPYEKPFFGYSISLVGNFIELTSTFGLSVKYDRNHYIRVGVPDNYKEKVEGFCGNYNGNSADDLMIRESQELTNDVNAFGSSYKTDQDCTTDFEDPRECSDVEQIRYTVICQNILNSKCLDECYETIFQDIQNILDNCVFDACAQSDIMIAVEQATVAISDICLVNGFCTGCMDPPDGLPNGMLNAINLPLNDAGLYPFGSIARYECAPGFQGEKQNFITCLDSGVWEDLPLECVEAEAGPIHWCSGSGDPHYRSFDGRTFDFQGICTYLFVATTEDVATSNLPGFVIEVENENRFGNTAVSYLKRIIIHVGADTISLEQNGGTIVNLMPVNLPYINFFEGYSIENDGTETILTMRLAVTVRYRGDHLINVGIPQNYMGKVEGLCGNFNLDADDDFLIRGTNNITPLVNIFANSYQIDSNCTTDFEDPPPCAMRMSFAEQCEEFVTENPCFTSCMSSFEDIAQLIADCTFDACAQNDTTLALTQTLDAGIELCFSISGLPCTGCGRPPTAPANGVLVGIDQAPNAANLFPYGSVATYECFDGFQAINRDTITCQNTNQWENLPLQCVQKTNICDPSPCDRNALCIEATGTFRCACNAGFTGTGLPGECRETNMCDPSPCDRNALCIEAPGTFRCACNAGFTGTGLPGECRALSAPVPK